MSALRWLALSLLVVPVLVAGASAGAAEPGPGPSQAGAGNVEPLSVPLRLTMTAEQVVAALGQPRSDYRSFGGGIGYPGLRILFDAAGKEISTVTIEGDARLAGGLGVGDAEARVKAAFPGGSMVYDSYTVTSGQYALEFRLSSGVVNRIVIRPAGRRFTSPVAADQAAPLKPDVALAALAGRWIDPKNAQSFDLRADGRYRTGVGGEGRVTVSGDGLVFAGALAAWNQGRATVSADRKVIEFYWKNADGSVNAVAFLRAGP